MKTRLLALNTFISQDSEPQRRHIVPALCLLAGALWLSPTTARAISGSWTSDSNGNWSDTSKWSGGTVADGAGSTATFNINITANRTVTLDSSRTIGVVLFGDTSGNSLWTLRTLNSSVLTMDNGANKPLVRAVQAAGDTISVVLAGANGIRGPDTASGTLILSAANTYTGDTEVDRNIMRLGVANAIPSGAGFGNVVMLATNGNPGDTSKLDINNFNPTINGLNSFYDPVNFPSYPNPPLVNSSAAAGTSTLTVGAADANGSFGGIIQNGATRTLALTKTGAGTQSLTNANTYTGATTISGGTLALAGPGSILNSASINVGAGATFNVSGVSSPPYLIPFGQTLNGSGGTGTIVGDLSMDGGASLALTYASGTPTLNVSSGTLTLNGGATTVTVTGTPLANGSYKLISKSGAGSVAGTVGSVTVTGSGIAGGGAAALAITSGELFLSITGGASVLEWGTGDGTWAVGVAGWGSGGATVWADGNAALLSDTFSSGNPTITLNTEVLPQDTVVSSTRNYTITGTGDIGGTGDLRKLGAGSLTLNVSNSYSGGSTLFEGTLNVKNTNALGATSGTFTIAGGTLDNTSGGPLSLNDYPQAWNGNFTFPGSSDLNLGAGAVTLGGTRTVTVTANTLTVGGDISGPGFGLVKAGAGTLVLGGNDSFTGGVTVNLGEVILANDGALNSASPNSVTFPTDTNVKTLSLNGHSVTVNNLAMGVISGGTATVVRNNHGSTAATLTINVPSSAQYAGTITDGGAAPLALTKGGAGNWTLGGGGVGSSTYSGDTTISGGTLTAGANNIIPFGAGKGNLIVNGTFDILDRGLMAANGLSGSGTVNRSNPGGAPVCTLTLGNGDASGSFSGRIRNTGTSATLNVTKTGTGTQALSGANTYTGTTIVNGGTLLVNSPGSLAGGSAVTVNSGATIGGSGTINGPVTVNSGGTVAAGASAGLLTVNNSLSLASSTTNVWELAANDIFGPGINFDQIVITGSGLALDPTSVLRIKFIGTATSPSLANSFWQYPRQWQVIAGPNAGPSNFGGIDGTNGITAGTFTTTADGSGVTLVYTPSVASPAPSPATITSLTPGPSTNYTLAYSGGTGSQFVLVTSQNVDTPLISWTPVATNVAVNGSFVIPVGLDPQGFYRIISE